MTASTPITAPGRSSAPSSGRSTKRKSDIRLHRHVRRARAGALRGRDTYVVRPRPISLAGRGGSGGILDLRLASHVSQDPVVNESRSLEVYLPAKHFGQLEEHAA